MMTTDENKIREDKARRIAERRGFALSKSRRRDPLAVDYGRFYMTPFDENGQQLSFSSIDEVEAFLDSLGSQR